VGHAPHFASTLGESRRPHLNYYEGSATVTGIRLYVPTPDGPTYGTAEKLRGEG